MIDDAAPITFRNGTLDLNSFDQALGELFFFNGHITTGTGTAHLLDCVIQSSIFPVGTGGTIDGRVTLQTNTTVHVISPFSEFYLSASVSGPGGITKQGSGTLAMYTTNAVNTFTGPLTVNDGMLLLWEAPFALNGVPGEPSTIPASSACRESPTRTSHSLSTRPKPG